jgi:dTDP-4-dehydrorhamnose 3,5-epimerase-like enzyme
MQELEHFTDDRGWLVEFVKSSSIGTIAQVEVISFKEPNIKRGGHYHKLKKRIGSMRFWTVRGQVDRHENGETRNLSFDETL